nr:lysine-specific demethylase REF6 [Ipomoea batatas]
MGEGSSGVEVLSWLKTLPVAPEYHPTLEEFQDPIAYIFKIEGEASKYGICKIVPPVGMPPKKTAIANLNKSLAARPHSTFTTRQQQIGFCPRRHRPVQKPVWQSGENYTLQQFEAKAKGFEKNYLKKGSKKGLSPLEVESLYWKATVDKPFSVEYANDIPGSAFAPKKADSVGAVGEGATVAETEWNMRGVSRARGSLLKFMKEEIPGVTSPMVYIAMMFSWFAWHVEDHDLHSLNYLHMGAGKTWYGVPRDAAVAFEEVIRLQGYGGEINPLVTFATLGEKTTVMSPEVLLNAGVPCCRLVQDVGEFVVTFPRAYHSGFSHGFNCGEASNIATPGWLRVAKDAAIRRASINCPPMVSHFQLLYDLALSFCSRMSKNIRTEPRSSRLKDKKKDEGEALVKDFFVQDLEQNNSLLHMLGRGSSVILLPRNSTENFITANFQGSQFKVKPGLFSSVDCPDDAVETGKDLDLDYPLIGRKQGMKQTLGVCSNKGKSSPLCESTRLPISGRDSNVSSAIAHANGNMNTASERAYYNCDRSSEHGLFSCVTCGILCYTCVAIVQPTKAASRCLMSTDYASFSQWREAGGGTTAVDADTNVTMIGSSSGLMVRRPPDSLFDVSIKPTSQLSDESVGVVSTSRTHKVSSSLGLLASTYGDSSDSEADETEADVSVKDSEGRSMDCSPEDEIPLQLVIDPYADHRQRRAQRDSETANRTSILSCSLQDRRAVPSCAPSAQKPPERAVKNALVAPFGDAPMPSDEDSSRMHVFCLQHAVEVEKELQLIGGAHISLLCHPDYPKLEAQAKKIAKESGSDYPWNDILFQEATKDDEKLIRSALDSEDAIHGNGDWAVKLGINLFYSANLSRSTLYRKQMPYNSVIYSAFGCSSPGGSPTSSENNMKVPGKHKRIVVAGKWCGKVWMSNQVHSLLAERVSDEQEIRRNASSRFVPDGKPPPMRSLECNQTTETATPTCRTGKKRKSVTENRPPANSKSVKTDDDDPDETLSVGFSQLKSKTNLRNKRIKREAAAEPQKDSDKKSKGGGGVDFVSEDEVEGGPSTRLRRRAPKPVKQQLETKPAKQQLETKPIKAKSALKKPEPKKPKQQENKKAKKGGGGPVMKVPAGNSSNPKKTPAVKNPPISNSVNKKGVPNKAPSNSAKARDEDGEYPCDLEGCVMSFDSKQELVMHKKNICPVKGCGKKFFSHKYLVQHRRVHMDDRPLKCPWKGCKMTFKWAWARTEHIRVHTGARPYVCAEPGCGQTFRFVSDFSRHKRKTGHSTKK